MVTAKKKRQRFRKYVIIKAVLEVTEKGHLVVVKKIFLDVRKKLRAGLPKLRTLEKKMRRCAVGLLTEVARGSNRRVIAGKVCVPDANS